MTSAGPGRYDIPDRAAPSAVERSAMVGRRDELIASLRGADLEGAKRRVAKLFGMMPVWGLDAATAVEVVSDYGKVLSSQPIWAIDAACIAVIEGGAKFRPGAPEFLALAKNAADPFRAELSQIAGVLDASVYREPDPSERERVIARFAEMSSKFAADLGMKEAVKRTKKAAPAQPPTMADDKFAHLRGPLTVSDSLRANITARAMGDDQDQPDGVPSRARA